MKRPPALARLAACVAIALIAAPGLAQPVDPTTRGAARKIAADAIELFDRAEYGASLEKFELANRLFPAPTLGLRAARCLDKLGRLIEAAARYLEVEQMPLDAGAPELHRQAQADAAAERAELVARIPTLAITVTGPMGTGVAVTLDGKPLPAAALGRPQTLDPGHYVIEARRADVVTRREVDLVERMPAQIALELPPLPRMTPPAPPPPAVATAPQPVASGRGSLRRAGWIGLGVGVAGLAVGAGSGIAALVQENALEARCRDRICPPAAYGDADRYDVTRAVATIGFVLGAAGVVTGVTLLAIAPADDYASGEKRGVARRPPPARIDAFVAWNSAGLRGIF